MQDGATTNGVRTGPFVPLVRKGNRGGVFDDLTHADNVKPGEPARSAEGWILFASNLDPSTTEEDVKDFFSEFGKVHLVKMLIDARTCRCMGSAIVEFLDREAADRAVNDGSGTPFVNDLPIKISFAFIVPEEEDDDVPADDVNIAQRRQRPQEQDAALGVLREGHNIPDAEQPIAAD